MKILRVKLSNLNSLRGPHEVNFQAAPLAGAGLFAITGPTGAGKSTLLDAITLALYGRAARYGTTPSPEDMMSRHCGDCAAEVEFQVPTGIYRAEWQLRRAHGKAAGKVQGAKRYVYDAHGQTLAQSVQETERLIESLIGLDYDRFLRSALLAQGDFAQFLKARPDDRAALLESLTGTSIYSELGTLAHTETVRQENDLQTREASLRNIQLLADEQRAKLSAEIPVADTAIRQIKLDLQQANERLNHAANLAAALEKERKAVGLQPALAADRLAAAPDLQRLAQHRLTVPFQEDLGKMDAASQAVANGRTLLEQARKEHAQARQKAALCQRGLQQMVTGGIETARKSLQNCQEKIRLALGKKTTADTWLQQHAPDANLPARLTDLVGWLATLKGARKDLAREWMQFKSVVSRVDREGALQLPSAADELESSAVSELLSRWTGELADRVSRANTARQTAETELHLREDHLKQSRLVASFEQHRASLKAGEPCPLCGATDHPFTTGTPPAFPFQQLEARIAEARALHRKLETDYTGWLQLQRDLPASGKLLVAVVKEHREVLDAAGQKLAEFSQAIPLPGAEDTLKTALQTRADEYSRQVTTAAQAERDQTAAQEELERRNMELAALLDKQAALAGEAETAPAEAADPGINLDATLPHWPTIAAAETDWHATRAKLTAAGTTLANRTSDADRLRRALTEITVQLAEALVGSTFESMESLKAARLNRADVARIETAENALQERAQRLAADLRAAQEAIAQWRLVAAPEGPAVADMKERQVTLEKQHDQLIRDLENWRTQLLQDDANRKLVAEKQKELATDRQRVVVWQQLSGLIGSYDGRTFRRYAQSVSLDVLVHYANRQLLRLNDRYQLRRRPGEELELEIADLHQAGAIRPMASLSGGESFLASLALALGLSNIAGRKVRIESLFIDEGFGTLDSDTLDVAISALETLRQDNKTVGVISHVDLLKERIATQIVVEKQSGGTSTIRVTS